MTDRARDLRAAFDQAFGEPPRAAEPAGVDLLRGNMPRMKQTPLTPPKRTGRPLSEKTSEVTTRVVKKGQSG